MPETRQIRLFRNGRNQAIRIPVAFELPGETVLMHREGNRLVIEPVRERSVRALLASWEPIEGDFPNFDEGMLPAREVEL